MPDSVPVNAGAIPANSWVQESEEGGGRAVERFATSSTLSAGPGWRTDRIRFRVRWPNPKHGAR